MNLARGFLVVEGIHDKRVLEHFYGDLLRRDRLVVIPVHGTRNARFLAEAEYVLFDNTVDEIEGSAEASEVRPPIESRQSEPPAAAHRRVGGRSELVFFAVGGGVLYLTTQLAIVAAAGDPELRM